jgi:hypothetical protein
MTNIVVAPALWASCNLPAGFITHWLVPDGALVRAGDPLLEVQLDDGLHEITTPVDGKLVIDAQIFSFIEPGSVLGRVGLSRICPSQILTIPHASKITEAAGRLGARFVTSTFATVADDFLASSEPPTPTEALSSKPLIVACPTAQVGF